MKCGLVVAVSIIVLSTGLLSQVQALRPNPIIGSWKQNMEKSTYSPGPPPLKGSYAVRQYAAGTDGSIVAITMNIGPEALPSLGAISAANYEAGPSCFRFYKKKRTSRDLLEALGPVLPLGRTSISYADYRQNLRSISQL